MQTADLAARMGRPDACRRDAIDAAAKRATSSGDLSDPEVEAYVRGLQWLALGKRADHRTPAILSALAGSAVPRSLLAIATRNIDTRLTFELRHLGDGVPRTAGPTKEIITLGRRLGLALEALHVLGL